MLKSMAKSRQPIIENLQQVQHIQNLTTYFGKKTTYYNTDIHELSKDQLLQHITSNHYYNTIWTIWKIYTYVMNTEMWQQSNKHINNKTSTTHITTYDKTYDIT